MKKLKKLNFNLKISKEKLNEFGKNWTPNWTPNQKSSKMKSIKKQKPQYLLGFSK